ncbi:hypothetical protein DR64_7773 [Paraburkholderia xenovorans LB400]|nr:hypothetical protein DR64_7773 [Paraburkholderia xenovorans LB400]
MYSAPLLKARVLWIMRHDTSLKASNPCVVDQYVQSAVFFQDMRRYTLPIAFFSNVKWQIRSAIANRRRHCSAKLIVDISDVDEATVLCE